MLSEPKCPSVCSTKYSLGIKPKPQASTPWNNSLCHSSEIFHYNLLNFKTDWQRDKSWGPDATCLFRVMKSRLRRGLWPFNLSPPRVIVCGLVCTFRFTSKGFISWKTADSWSCLLGIWRFRAFSHWPAACIGKLKAKTYWQAILIPGQQNGICNVISTGSKLSLMISHLYFTWKTSMQVLYLVTKHKCLTHGCPCSRHTTPMYLRSG